MSNAKPPDVPLCECCGQPMPPPKKPTTFLVTHRVDTQGHPPAYCLKAEHAITLAETRWTGGLRSELWATDKLGVWRWWRSYEGR